MMKTKIISALLCIATILSMGGIFGTSVFAYDIHEVEDNDRIENANTIEVNTRVYGATDNRNQYQCDDDYFKFTLNAPGYIFIDASNEGKSAGNIYVYSFDGSNRKTMIAEYFSSATESIQSVKIGLDAGKYYIAVTSTTDFYYSFKVNYVKTNNWEKERNADISTATTIPLNTTIYGTLYDSYEFNNDEDYYKFVIGENGKIEIPFSKSISASGFYIRLYSYNGIEKTEIKNTQMNNEGEKASIGYTSVKPGTYFLRVYGRTSGYNFRINFTAGSAEIPTAKTTKPQAKTTMPSTAAATPTVRHSYNTQPSDDGSAYRDYDVAPDGFVDYYDDYTNAENAENVDVTESENLVANNTMNNGEFEYTVDDGHIVINLYLGNDRTVTVPEYLNGYEVWSLAANLFKDTTAKKVEIPNTVKEFGENVFGQDSGQDIVVVCDEGSPAEAYAKDNDIRYVYKNGTDVKKTSTLSIVQIVIIGAALALIIAVAVFVAMKKKGTNRA